MKLARRMEHSLTTSTLARCRSRHRLCWPAWRRLQPWRIGDSSESRRPEFNGLFRREWSGWRGQSDGYRIHIDLRDGHWHCELQGHDGKDKEKLSDRDLAANLQ